jgi:hypothetical protein
VGEVGEEVRLKKKGGRGRKKNAAGETLAIDQRLRGRRLLLHFTGYCGITIIIISIITLRIIRLLL